MAPTHFPIGTLIHTHTDSYILEGTNMIRTAYTKGGTVALLAGLALLAGCASGPRTANESAIDLGRKVVKDSIPTAGLVVQAMLELAPPQDMGSYRTDRQRFCMADERTIRRARQTFADLCKVKGAIYEGDFCRRTPDSDDVAFMAKFDRQGTGGCYTLDVAEPKAGAASGDYQKYLVDQGFVTATRRQQEALAAQEVAQARATRQQQIDEARRRAEEARLTMELPSMKKRGARVCKTDNDRVLSGFVEDFTDEKLKVLVTGGYMARVPSIQVQVPTGTMHWDYFVSWRLC